MNFDQKSFNSFQDDGDEDPDLAWKSKAIKPITRNKIIVIAAHVLQAIIYPVVFAQNEDQEEDKDAATVMRMLMEWVGDNYNYAQTLLYSVIAALVNPAAVIHLEFAENYRTIKETNEKGKWTDKKILDEMFSGFRFTVVPLDELLISNIYEHDIQKQNFLIWRRVFDYDTAKSKYKDAKNWKYVKPGIQRMYDEASKTFYDLYDRNLFDIMVEEVIYYNRTEDLQLAFVNGVIMTEPDQPNPRKDKLYPFVKFGFEPVDEGKFFYYKSLAFKEWPEQEIVNKLYRAAIDGTMLQGMPPTAVYGDEHFESSIVAPGAISVLKKDSKIEKIDVGANPGILMNTLREMESSMADSSVNFSPPPGRQTAFALSIYQQNAKILLGLFGRMISFGVKSFGELLGSDIIQFMTVGEVEEISGDLKYKSFLMPSADGVSKQIKFDPSMTDEPMTAEDRLLSSYQILQEQGGMDSKKEIYKVNPELFRRRKFLYRISPDEVTPPSEAIKKGLMLEEYDRAINNPMADQEAITRDLLFGAYDKTRNNTDKYIKKAQPAMPGQNPMGQVPNSQMSNVPQGNSPMAKILGAGIGSQKEMAIRSA